MFSEPKGPPLFLHLNTYTKYIFIMYKLYQIKVLDYFGKVVKIEKQVLSYKQARRFLKLHKAPLAFKYSLALYCGSAEEYAELVNQKQGS